MVLKLKMVLIVTQLHKVNEILFFKTKLILLNFIFFFFLDLIYCTTDLTNSTIDAPSFYECTSLKKIQQKSHDSKITWISIAAGLFSFFVLFIGNLIKLIKF